MFSFCSAIFYEKSPRAFYSTNTIELRFDRQYASELQFDSREKLKLDFDGTVFHKMLSKMNLKHVTSNDWHEFFLRFTNPPNAAELDYEESADEDEENNEDN